MEPSVGLGEVVDVWGAALVAVDVLGVKACGGRGEKTVTKVPNFISSLFILFTVWEDDPPLVPVD